MRLADFRCKGRAPPCGRGQDTRLRVFIFEMRVWELESGVERLGFGVWGLGIRDEKLDLRVYGFEFRDSGFRVKTRVKTLQ